MAQGVFSAQKKSGEIYYRSSITYKQKHISLGSYPTWEAANTAYLEARRLLDTLSEVFSPDYKEDILPFSKYVSLMNFRDNGYYFTSPIYAYPRYFSYYLSQKEILKFDIDDLFFYSSRRIMKRGSHLFVSDYGMQTSLLSRFGIRPYAVAGKDYLFVNGDSTDYRYQNIEIINPYHGVEKIKRGGRDYYKCHIHIRSNYVIGTYDSLQKAAIAYNKAADILTANGFVRDFMQNYIDGISPKAYAELYSSIRIPDSIRSLKP